MNSRPGPGRLRGKSAIVTGGSRGIGLAIARGLAREGANVVLAGRQGSALAGPAAELAGLGVKAIPVQADVSQQPDVERLVARAVDELGRVDILVNNAGIQYRLPSEQMDIEGWRRVIDTNLNGVFMCCQAAGRVMLKQRSGSIINIASLSSFVGMPQRAPYGTAKTAVVGLTRVLAAEWGRRGVRVNAIAPGYILTEMTKNAIATGMLAPEEIIARTPLGRMGEPEDMAGLAIFLASDESAFITGQTIAADGGFLAYGYLRTGSEVE
ncbi:MAG: 3-oxoacyl-ACP reductase FabG [Chloroflexi bacterium]|nr:3-oxoacyl-ACP reductase FabG [Chloroflexota bacterium]MCL5107289.1 3-oxoacyl-ACP reductase FabG [Chloroflexota bacterium]